MPTRGKSGSPRHRPCPDLIRIDKGHRPSHTGQTARKPLRSTPREPSEVSTAPHAAKHQPKYVAPGTSQIESNASAVPMPVAASTSLG